MVKKAIKTAIFQLYDANMTLATIFSVFQPGRTIQLIVGGLKKISKIKNKKFSENRPNFQKINFERVSWVKKGFQNPVEWLWCIVLT
jgi:hypothetical protein